MTFITLSTIDICNRVNNFIILITPLSGLERVQTNTWDERDIIIFYNVVVWLYNGLIFIFISI